MKKALCILLTLLLALGAFSPAALAAADEPNKVDLTKPPIIFIDGINSRELVRDMGQKDEETVFPPDAGEILTLVQENAAAVWDMLDGDYSAENRQAVVDAVLGLLDGIGMNDDGTSRYDVSIDWVYPGRARPTYSDGTEAEQTPLDAVKEGVNKVKNWLRSLFREEEAPLTEEEQLQKMLEYRGTYTFRYDWRLDPFESAEGLRDFICYIQELTGFDRVSIVGFSQGAAVLNTYLTLYGYDGLETAVWYSGAHNGVEQVGQLMTGRVHVDADALTDFVRESTETDPTAYILSVLMQALTDIGVTGNLLEYTNKIINALLEDGGIRQVIRATVGKMPAIWAFVSDEYYEEAKAYVFNEPGDAETYAELIETIDRYHYEVQAHSYEIMENARLATGKIGVISKYGLRVTPLIENGDVLTDGVIDVAGSSCGAKAAPYGRTLGDNYVQAVADGHDHLSPDGMIDASAALYPDYTWFVKNASHSEGSDYIDGLLNFICYADAQVTVFDDPAYPQFAVHNRLLDTTEPLTAQNAEPRAFQKALWRARAFFTGLLERLRAYFR